MSKRYRCQEVDCDWTVSKDDNEELVEAAQQHAREAHESIEMEAVIIENAEQTNE
jgi:predicted small metal-binding protein